MVRHKAVRDKTTRRLTARSLRYWTEQLVPLLDEAKARQTPRIPFDSWQVAEILIVLIEGTFIFAKTMDSTVSSPISSCSIVCTWSCCLAWSGPARPPHHLYNLFPRRERAARLRGLRHARRLAASQGGSRLKGNGKQPVRALTC